MRRPRGAARHRAVITPAFYAGRQAMAIGLARAAAPPIFAASPRLAAASALLTLPHT